MPVAPGPSRRFVILLVGVSFCLAFAFVSSFRSQDQGVRHPLAHGSGAIHVIEDDANSILDTNVDISPSILSGHVIAPKLGNETVKYVLSRMWSYRTDMEKHRIPTDTHQEQNLVAPPGSSFTPPLLDSQTSPRKMRARR